MIRAATLAIICTTAFFTVAHKALPNVAMTVLEYRK